MLNPLVHAATSQPHYTASAEPPKPKPSPYDPPSDLASGGQKVRTHELLKKGDVTFSREITWRTLNPDNPTIASNQLVVETGNADDKIHVRSWPGDKLQFIINGKSYVFDAQGQQGPQQSLLIKTNGGNDRVIIDDDVKHQVGVDGGDGDDYLQAGGGPTELRGNGGNDTLRLGSGFGIARGGAGNDTLYGGSGHTSLFGDDGNDRLHAGFGNAHKWNVLMGGAGDDTLFAGSGDNYLHGEDGDDQLVGYDRTSFFTGEGKDRIWNNKSKDKIFAGARDEYDTTQGSSFTEVKPNNTDK